METPSAVYLGIWSFYCWASAACSPLWCLEEPNNLPAYQGPCLLLLWAMQLLLAHLFLSPDCPSSTLPPLGWCLKRVSKESTFLVWIRFKKCQFRPWQLVLWAEWSEQLLFLSTVLCTSSLFPPWPFVLSQTTSEWEENRDPSTQLGSAHTAGLVIRECYHLLPTTLRTPYPSSIQYGLQLRKLCKFFLKKGK